MKSREELREIKTKFDEISRSISGLNKAEQREKADSIDRELSELTEDELKDVAAGTAFSAGSYAYSVFIHSNCGGEIMNVGDPFSSCYCNKCGETHYWHYSFDYTVEHTEP